jgi:hypothetical protein
MICFATIFIFGFFLYLLMNIGRRKIVWWPCNMLFLWLYLLVAIISCFSYCPEPKYSLYEIWKFFCAIVLYWNVVNLVQSDADIHAVLTGCFTAVAFESAVVITAKYGLHLYVARVIGTFPHPNSLAMYINTVNQIAVCMLMGGFAQHPLFTAAAAAGGMVCILFTKSRDALVMMIMALLGCIGISFLRRPTFRKSGAIVMIMFFGAIVGTLAAPRLIQRFQNAPKESEQTRVYFNHAAKAMMRDHLFGIAFGGSTANQYGINFELVRKHKVFISLKEEMSTEYEMDVSINEWKGFLNDVFLTQDSCYKLTHSFLIFT